MISPRPHSSGKAPAASSEMMDSSGGKPVSPRALTGPPKNYEEIVRVLADIKIRNQKVKEIIKRSPAEDVEEFSSTNLLVEATVQRLLNQDPTKMFVSLTAATALQAAVKAFQSYIAKLEESGKIRRYLTNSHLRGKLENLNSAIDGELRIVATENRTETRLRSFSKIHDDEGQMMWERQFGSSVDQIHWTTFLKGIGLAVASLGVSITEEDERLLRLVLDNSRTGYVSSYRFSEFLKGFGPMSRAIPYMRSILKEKWFYGFLSGEESIRLLQGQPTGTYLVRFSRSRPGSFALSFVWTNGDVLPVLINGCMPQGLKIREQGEVERTFGTLYDVLDYYRKWLLIPFASQLSRESWFHGDVSKEEAEELLLHQKPGTFLMRFGDVQGSFWCSFVSSRGPSGGPVVEHVEVRAGIDPTSGHTLPQEQKGSAYATLTDYVRANRHILRFNYDPEGIPQLRIKNLEGRTICTLYGPEDNMQPCDVSDAMFSAKSFSTYPTTPGGYSLNCDRWALQVLANWTVACVADGCNWGNKPHEAACRASAGFVQYVSERAQRMPDLREVAMCLLRAFNFAHHKIIEGKAEPLEAGTTTLLGGALMELAETDRFEDYKYAFVCGSVGDCKAFLWQSRTRTVVDITARNRGGIDARDPGGRLGPHIDGAPDVRNLRVFFELCREGDVVLLMTDGIHDNLDPKSLGKEPADFGYNVSWDVLPADAAERIKHQFQTELLAKVLERATDPASMVRTLCTYSSKVTKAGRDFMDQNPKAKQPNNYKLYPGKMDHATVVALPVLPTTMKN